MNRNGEINDTIFILEALVVIGGPYHHANILYFLIPIPVFIHT